jgi:hypothetical protein
MARFSPIRGQGVGCGVNWPCPFATTQKKQENPEPFSDYANGVLGVAEKDVVAVDYAVQQMAEDPEFLSRSHATEEQIIKAMWPNRKVS